jgi:phosphoesterase RecJ-like protein
VGEPGFVVPPSLAFLPGVDLVVAPEQVAVPDVVVVCDTASVERLGILADAVAAAPICIAIDHHPSFTGFGTVHVVDADAPATAALALRLIDLLDVELDRDIAAAVYAGLATDTGSFKFHATTSDTMRMAARLFDAGIDHARLARLLFDDEPLAALQVMGEALQRATLVASAVGGAGLVHTSISVEQRRGLSELGLERVIDSLRRASEAEVAAVFKQSDSGAWKVSLRSKDAVDVGSIASSLGGGGHRYAAGYTGSTDLATVVAELMAALDAAAR